MSRLSPTSPAHDPEATSSPAPNDTPEVLPDTVDPIVSQWRRLASMDRQSPDFPSLLSSLITGTNRSSTIKLRSHDAKITLDALDQVGCSLAIAREWSSGNLYRTTRQVFRDGEIPNECGRGTLSVMRALAHESCQVPPRYQIEPHTLSVEGDAIDGGGSSDVRKGRLGNKIVAVKTLRSRNIDAQKVCDAPSYFFGMCQQTKHPI